MELQLDHFLGARTGGAGHRIDQAPRPRKSARLGCRHRSSEASAGVSIRGRRLTDRSGNEPHPMMSDEPAGPMCHQPPVRGRTDPRTSRSRQTQSGSAETALGRCGASGDARQRPRSSDQRQPQHDGGRWQEGPAPPVRPSHDRARGRGPAGPLWSPPGVHPTAAFATGFATELTPHPAEGADSAEPELQVRAMPDRNLSR